jgi:hypothetical protein
MKQINKCGLNCRTCLDDLVAITSVKDTKLTIPFDYLTCEQITDHIDAPYDTLIKIHSKGFTYYYRFTKEGLKYDLRVKDNR